MPNEPEEDFYEEDEPAEAVLRAFQSGTPKGVTGPGRPVLVTANTGQNSSLEEIRFGAAAGSEVSWIQPGHNRGSGAIPQPV